jgi:cephalosporin-C deacetylase
MFVDIPEEELRRYRSAQTCPADFDAFWSETLTATQNHDLDVRVKRVDLGIVTLDVFDVTFAGFDGHPIKAWLRIPRDAAGPLPTIVQFQGYGGGRGHAFDDLLWASAGYAHLVMDTRGQGAAWGHGDTPDPVGAGPSYPGFMTRGIDSRDTYYYRRVYTDAVRAVRAARTLEIVDAERLAVLGASQGGGISLAVAGLVPDLAGVFARVPFLCDFPRAIVITDREPYKEVAQYLKIHREKARRAQDVLSYFDVVNFVRRATAPAWFSTALMDSTCPPSTVFGAYNAYAGPKQISVWPFNEHEGGGTCDDEQMMRALQRIFDCSDSPDPHD